MSYDISKKDVLWSYAAYLFKYGTNLFLLPLILKNLTSNEMGMWYTFTSVGAFVLLFDLGFSPTIMRNFSYAWSGAKEISQKGYNKIKVDTPNYKLLFKIMDTAKIIYLLISVTALVVILSVGTPYIKSIISKDMNYKYTVLAWIVYSLGIFLNIYYSYWNPLLIGIGKIKEYQKAVVFSQSIFLIVTSIGFTFNLGLISITFGYLVNGLALRLLCKYYYNKTKVNNNYVKTSLEEVIKNIKIMWHNAYRSALVSFGVYLEININTIIASKFLGLAETGSYGLILQIFLVIRAFSSTAVRTYLPAFNNLRVNAKIEELKISISKNLLLSWILYISIVAVFILFGKNILIVLGKESILPSKFFITIFAIQSFLVFNHGDLFSPIITTKNEIPFVIPTLCTGLAVGVMSYIFVKYLNWGIWGLLISSLVAEASYNNWKWPYLVKKELDLSLKFIIVQGFKSIIPNKK